VKTVSNPPTADTNDGSRLKRKVVGILGITGTLWAIVGFIITADPSGATAALMAGVAVTSTVSAVIGAE